MNVRLLFGAVAFSLLLAGCVPGFGGGREYPANRGDEEYKLAEMALQTDDVPEGYDRVGGDVYSNEEWADLLVGTLQGVDDLEGAKRQLDALGRVRGQYTLFTWENPLEHLGKVLQITSLSTLYAKEEDAKGALQEYCGLPVGNAAGVEDWEKVPEMANEAVGFSIRQDAAEATSTSIFIAQLGAPLGVVVDNVFCFRTGRVVHVVVQNGLEGTEDKEGTVALAKKMLARVDASFDGKGTEEKGEE